MKKLILLFSLFAFSSSTLFAEQSIMSGNYVVHYSAFPSTVISPKVAASYGLKRSEYRALLNITPQIKNEDGVKGIKAKLKGKAQNLVGQSQTLEFKEIIEGDVIYYLAEFSFSNEEHFRFFVELETLDGTNTLIPLKFEKKFIR
jgi:hypothetical protein